MTFENLIYTLKFLNKNLELIDIYKRDPFMVKAHLFNKELIIGFENVTYTCIKYYISYCGLRHIVEISGKENRDLLTEYCDELIKNIIEYSKGKLLTDIRSYENISSTACNNISF